MIKHIGKFECCVMRDVMHVVSQFSDIARMKLDTSGIHIEARNGHNSAAVWIDMPKAAFIADGDFEDPIFKEDIGFRCEKLYRVLNAYEEDQEIRFSQEITGSAEMLKIDADGGTFQVYQTSLDYLHKMPDQTFIRTANPLHASCDISAEGFREWLNHIQVVTNQVSFRYVKSSGKFPVQVISVFSPESVVMSHPDVDPDAPEEFESLYTLELLQNTIAPECIDSDIRFSFGDQSSLFMGVQLHGCDIAMAIAPRIEV